MYTGNNMSVIGILVIGLTAMCGHAMAQSSSDVEGAKAASKAFYSALSVIDNGAALDKVVAHTSYVTLVGPRDKAVRVGYDAWRTYWPQANKLYVARKISLSDQHIYANGNLAYEMGHESGIVKLKNGKERKADLIVTNVYEKIDGHWLMISHHTHPKPK